MELLKKNYLCLATKDEPKTFKTVMLKATLSETSKICSEINDDVDSFFIFNWIYMDLPKVLWRACYGLQIITIAVPYVSTLYDLSKSYLASGLRFLDWFWSIKELKLKINTLKEPRLWLQPLTICLLYYLAMKISYSLPNIFKKIKAMRELNGRVLYNSPSTTITAHVQIFTLWTNIIMLAVQESPTKVGEGFKNIVKFSDINFIFTNFDVPKSQSLL